MVFPSMQHRLSQKKLVQIFNIFFVQFQAKLSLTKTTACKEGRRDRGGGAKYLGPGPVGTDKILVKRLLMGATVKRVGGGGVMCNH